MGKQPIFARVDDPPGEVMRGSRGQRVFLVGPYNGAEHVDVHINILNVDSGPGPVHYHAHSENVYIVLEGQVEVTIDGKAVIGNPGDVVYVPAGTHHSAGTYGDQRSKIVEIYAPPITHTGERDFVIVSGGYNE